MHRLLVTAGPDLGREFVLSHLPMNIGRGYEAQIRLADGAVSRLQARVERDPAAGVRVVDLQSTNGTKVNGERTATHALADGDEIAFGRTVLRFEGDDSATGGLDISHSVAIDSDERTLLGGDPASVRRESTGGVQRALIALYRADAVLDSPGDLEAGLQRLLDLCFEVFEAERGAVVLLDSRSGEMRRAVERRADGAPADVPVSRSLLARVSDTRQALLSRDAQDGGRSVMCAPLVHQDGVFGAVYVDTPHAERPFSESDLRLFGALARKTALVVANAQLNADLRGLFFNTLEAIVDAIQMKDPYTRGHSERVRRYALLLARELGVPPEARRKLHISAVLHDVGKIGMPDRLLFNTDELTDDERVEVQHHPVRGAQFLEKIPLLHDVIDGVKYHHENWDGSGYPDGLAGDDIPLQGRIVAVADTFDACTTDRPYQKGVSRPEAIRILRKLAGNRLDPAMVGAFEAALLSEGLLKEPVPVEE